MINQIYLDNAATTPIKSFVWEVFNNNEPNCWGNASSSYSFGKQSKKMLDEARKIIAESIGAKPNEIFFTSGATEANNWAMQIAKNIGGCIGVSTIEHKSIYNSPALKSGIEVVELPVDYTGTLKLEKLYKLISSNKYGTISSMAVNNETGSIGYIDIIGKICDNNGWVFHTDATQAIGKVHINVKDMYIGMMSASGHKLGAFKGTGFLYVDESLHKYMTPIISGGSQQYGMRGGTEPVTLYLSLAYAVKDAVRREYIDIPKYARLANIVRHELKLADIKYTENCVYRKTQSIMSLTIPGVNASSLVAAADICGLAISDGSACNTDRIEPSYVLTAIGLNKKDALNTIRISFSNDSEEKDVLEGAKRLIKAIHLVSEE